MLLSRRHYISQTDPLVSSRAFECTNVVNKSIIQSKYTCKQCFPYEHGICQHCYENCHKRKQHLCQNIKIRDNFICECAICNHKSIPLKTHEKCQFQIFSKSNNICPKCQISVCEHCQNKHHTDHFINDTILVKQVKQDCQQKDRLLSLDYEEYIRTLVQIKYYKQGDILQLRKNKLVNREKQYQNNKLIQTIFDTDLNQILFSQFRVTMHQIADSLEAGDINYYQNWINQVVQDEQKLLKEKVQVSFKETLPYKSIEKKIIFLQRLILHIKDKHIDDRIFEIAPIDTFTIIFSNIGLFQQMLQIKYINHMHIFSLQMKSLWFKQKISNLRQLDHKSISNTTPISRLIIQFQNQSKDVQTGLEIKSQIKRYMLMIFELEIKDKLLGDIFTYMIKILYYSLRTRLLTKVKFLTKVFKSFEKLNQEIGYYNQQTKGQIDNFIQTERNFTLLSKIMILAIYNLKDQRFQEFYDKVVKRQRLTSGLMESIFHSEQEKIKKQFFDLNFDSSKKDFQQIYKSLFNLLIDPNLVNDFFQRSDHNRTKFNNNIVLVMKNQLNRNSLYSLQLQSLTAVDFHIWNILKDQKKSNSKLLETSIQEIDDILKYYKIDDINIQHIISNLNLIEKSVNIQQINQEVSKLDQALQITQSKQNLELSELLNLDICSISQNQCFLFQVNLDKTIFELLDRIVVDRVNHYQIKDIIKMNLDLLINMLVFNQTQVYIILNYNNKMILNMLAQQDIEYCQLVIDFYHELFCKMRVVNILQLNLINNDLFIQEIVCLYRILMNNFDDVSEISQQKYLQIQITSIKFVELLQYFIYTKFQDCEQETDREIDYDFVKIIFENVIAILADSLIEILRIGSESCNDISDSNIFQNRNIHNRYIKFTYNQCLDQLDILRDEMIQLPQNLQYAPIVQSPIVQSPLIQKLNSSDSFVSLVQDLNLEQVYRIIMEKLELLTFQSRMAGSGFIFITKGIYLLEMIIEFENRYLLFQKNEFSDLLTIYEKLEQLNKIVENIIKSNIFYDSRINDIPDLKKSLESFFNMMNPLKNPKSSQSQQIVQQSIINQQINQFILDLLQKQNSIYYQDTLSAINNLCGMFDKHKDIFQSSDIELHKDLMECNGMIKLLQSEYKNRNKRSLGQIQIGFLFEMIQYKTQFDLSRNQEFQYSIFMNQLIFMKIVLRQLIIETKVIQQIIKSTIEQSEQREDNFKQNFLNGTKYLVQQILPHLYQNVLMFEDQYQSIVINSGKYSILILEFVRYLAEGQNNYLQIYLGEQGVLEEILKLLVEILKSSHIFDIIRDKQNSQTAFTTQDSNGGNQDHFLIKRQRSAGQNFLNFIMRKRHDKQDQNDFLFFDASLNTKQQYNFTQTFIKLFAHTIITVAEYNQGKCTFNQRLTFDYLSKNRIWQIIIQILTSKINQNCQNSTYTLRMYLLQLILALIEDAEKLNEDFQFIMNLINYKILEQSLDQTYQSLTKYNKLVLQKKKIKNLTVQLQLTELYRQSLGDDINESLIFDSKILIRILYQIYKILNIYSTASIEIQQYLQDFKNNYGTDDKVTHSAFQFIYSIVGSIEYLNENNELQTLHFLRTPMSFFLSAETKIQFINENIDRSNPSSKIQSLFEVIPQFMAEMEENMAKYRSSKISQQLINIAISQKYLFISKFSFHHKQFSTVLMSLNFIVLMIISNNYRVKLTQDDDELVYEFEISHKLILNISQIFLLFISFLALVCQLFFRMSIYCKLNDSQQDINNLPFIIIKALMRKDIFQFVLFFILSLCGLFEPFFYYIQSFCYIYISKTMYSVLEALKLRWQQFLGIFFTLLIILNAYSYIGFRRFTTSFQLKVVTHIDIDENQEMENLCDTPWHCFLSLVNFGLREGTGLGTYGDQESYYKSPDYYPRFVFDLSFFILVTLIMLNIIHGIIIDAFADLRDQQQRNEYDRKNVCTICSLQRWQFEKKGQQFDYHVEEVHNIWNYVSFIVYLQKLGKENMNGIETYIYTKLLNKDMSWTPQENTQLLNL